MTDESAVTARSDYDLFSPDFKADPFPTYARMRRDAPIYGHRTPNGATIWYITRYADALKVLTDNERYCKDPRSTGLATVIGNASRRTSTHRLINENMLFSDPPDHTRLRALVSQAFTPQRITELSDYIQSTADNLIDAFEPTPTIDLIAAYALPIPVRVICKLLGVPNEDRDNVARWSQAIISPGSRNLNYSARKQRVQALTGYLGRLFAAKREQPQDDLISALVQAEVEGDRLSEAELSSMVALLLVTGHETTVNLIGNGALALLSHPQQLEDLRHDPQGWDRAVEELLRYDGPVETSTSRWATEDHRWDGKHIRRGDLIRVVLSSANRDAEQFPGPNQLQCKRSENKHLAFGFGIHYCLGAPLARLEGKIALKTLFTRLSDLKLALPPQQLVWRSGVLFRGLDRLDVQRSAPAVQVTL